MAEQKDFFIENNWVGHASYWALSTSYQKIGSKEGSRWRETFSSTVYLREPSFETHFVTTARPKTVAQLVTQSTEEPKFEGLNPAATGT